MNNFKNLFASHRLKKNLVLYLLLFGGLVYLFFVVSIAYYNRLALDDYCFKADLQRGFLATMRHYYTTWQGRFGAHLLINTTLLFYEKVPVLFIYILVLIAIYLYALVAILKKILPAASNLLRVVLALLIFDIFLITVYDFSSFYWLNASAMYFGGIAFALLGVSSMLSAWKSIFSFPILALSWVIAGSSAEHFGLMTSLLLLLALVFNRYLKIHQPKLILAFVCCGVAFLVMIFAEGTQVRRSLYPETSMVTAFYRAAKYLYYTILALTAQRAIFFLVLAVVMLYAGALLRKTENIDEECFIKKIVVALPIFMIFLIVAIAPMVYGIGGIGEYRALTHINFYIVIFIASISFLVAYKTNFPIQLAKLLAILGSLLFFIMANDLRIKLHYTKQYVVSEDARLKHLRVLKSKNTKGIVRLEPLYASSFNVLVSNELTQKGGFANQCICRALNLDFEIEKND